MFQSYNGKWLVTIIIWSPALVCSYLFVVTNKHELNVMSFLNQAHQLQAGVPGFLKLFLCGRLYVCLCVSAPKAINN